MSEVKVTMENNGNNLVNMIETKHMSAFCSKMAKIANGEMMNSSSLLLKGY